MPEVTKIMAGSNYWGGISLIIPLTFGNFFVFMYGLPVNIEYYHKKTGFISLGTILAAGLNAVLNYFWNYPVWISGRSIHNIPFLWDVIPIPLVYCKQIRGKRAVQFQVFIKSHCTCTYFGICGSSDGWVYGI